MTNRIIQLQGVYSDKEIIKIDNGNTINLSQLANKMELPSIPYGTKVTVSIKYDDIDFLNGTDGIVWATYNYLQSDTIINALFVQNIFGEIIISELVNKTLYKIYVSNTKDAEKAINFIWKNSDGLRLKPDWHYKENSENESFNKWKNAE